MLIAKIGGPAYKIGLGGVVFGKDAENGIIEVESGLRIGNLLSIILPKNWNVVGLSGSLHDTIGGMISGNTHGKDSWKNGNFGHNVVSLKLLLADGKIIEIDESSHPELFSGVIAGLGFLGIIFEVKLKLTPIPSYMVETTYDRISNFNDLASYLIKRKVSIFVYSIEDSKWTDYGKISSFNL